MSTTVTVESGSDGASYALVVLGGRSWRHDLAEGATTIGRAEDCGLRVDDTSISRQHARIVIERGGATLTDLGSHNGTTVNGQRLAEPRVLASGDVVAVGEATIVLYLKVPRARRDALASDILERLEAEMDRVHRYRDVLALIAWSLDNPQRASGLLASVLRRCDAAGVAPDGTLLGVFPGLDDTAATEVAQRALSLLRAASPHARAGVAVFPSDGIDAAALLLAARDALAATTDVGRPDRATRRVELGGETAIIGDPGMVRTYDLLRRATCWGLDWPAAARAASSSVRASSTRPSSASALATSTRASIVDGCRSPSCTASV